MEESKCMTCKNLFVATAKDATGFLFSHCSCLRDAQCFELLWKHASQVFTEKNGDALIPVIKVCSHYSYNACSAFS
jgi:hypothetical protein